MSRCHCGIFIILLILFFCTVDRLCSPIAVILTQRLLLAMEGIAISDYYGTRPPRLPEPIVEKLPKEDGTLLDILSTGEKEEDSKETELPVPKNGDIMSV